MCMDFVVNVVIEVEWLYNYILEDVDFLVISLYWKNFKFPLITQMRSNFQLFYFFLFSNQFRFNNLSQGTYVNIFSIAV